MQRLLLMLALLPVFLFGLQRSVYPLNLDWNVAAVIVREHQFDYVSWEIAALWSKFTQTLYGAAPFMNETARADFVRAYMADLARAGALEGQVQALFADPALADPQAASAELRAERDALRADLRARQTLAEAILEGQVASVLIEQGFGTLGQLLPPISMRFSQVPNLLIVSPRDAIRFDISINVNPLPVDQIVQLEAAIEDRLDVSSLIVPLGGIALYPAMVLETTSIPRALDTFAHEWLHHYLFAFPLGLGYDFAGETRIINETTAALFGQAIAPLVLARYYPELAQDAYTVRTAATFDFGAEMDLTRRTVDELLVEGAVAEAEAYMEERRQFFYSNGYLIRRLNQAFFAFYGGYQSVGSGVGGADPIGPAVAAIRDLSPSLHDWIITMRTITTREQLLAVREALEAETARREA